MGKKDVESLTEYMYCFIICIPVMTVMYDLIASVGFRVDSPGVCIDNHL